LRVALGRAVKDGFLQTNPAASLDILRVAAANRNTRRAFTLPELRRVLDASTGEWRGMLLFAIYTGQRLADLARLTWQNIDTEKQKLRFVTIKTGRRMDIDLAPPLLRHLATMEAGDTPDAPLFPTLHATAQKEGRTGTLSNQFHSLLVDAGLATPRTHKKKKEGRNATRAISSLSFHSLRHTTTSLLKNAGVSAVVAMDILGHDSEAVSRQYTHVDEDAKRRAITNLPDLTLAPAQPAKTAKRPKKAF